MRYVMKQVLILILLLLSVGYRCEVQAQIEVGVKLQALKFFGTDDDAFRPDFGASVGYQLNELYTLEAVAGFTPVKRFKTSQSFKAIDPSTQPQLIQSSEKSSRTNSQLFGFGFALRGIAVAADGKHKHLQLYGRLEMGWQQYSVEFLDRRSVYSWSTHQTTMPENMTLSTIYIEPSAGVEWIIGNVRPYLQIGANLPTYRQEVPEGLNLGLNTSLRISAGFRVQFGQGKWAKV